MNIAMFSDAFWPRVNGVTVSVDTFSRALVKAGHRVLVVCSEYPGEAAGESPSAKPQDANSPEVFRLPSGPVFFSKEDRAAKFSAWPAVEEKLAEFGPDIIHINTEFVVAKFGFRYGKKHGVPIVYTFHTNWEDYIANYFPYIPEWILRLFVRKYEKNLMNNSTLVIVPTAQILSILERYKVKKPSRMLPTGIEKELFVHSDDEKTAFRAKLDRNYPALAGKRILLFSGRVSKEKNISFIIRLMPAWLEKHPDLALLIVGNGPYLDFFKDEAKEVGVGESCVFTGYLDRSELSLCYAVSYLFVFPSLTETQGLVTIEAMLSGLPVVAIGVMGTVEVMGGDNGGFMVKNDSEEFKNRVLELLEDPELYRKKSDEAKEHGKLWTVDSLTERLAAIYGEARELKGQGR